MPHLRFSIDPSDPKLSLKFIDWVKRYCFLEVPSHRISSPCNCRYKSKNTLIIVFFNKEKELKDFIQRFHGTTIKTVGHHVSDSTQALAKKYLKFCTVPFGRKFSPLFSIQKETSSAGFVDCFRRKTGTPFVVFLAYKFVIKGKNINIALYFNRLQFKSFLFCCLTYYSKLVESVLKYFIYCYSSCASRSIVIV